MKEYNQEAINKRVEETLNQWNAGNKKPNVLICGVTGSGKTSFTLNHVFANESLVVGESAKPCTRDIELYEGENINIYDSEGYEIGSEKQAHYREMLIEEFLKKQTPESLQAVWYAVDGGGKKFTDLDISLIKEIQALHFPVAVLITKLDTLTDRQYDELKSAITDNVDAPVFAISVREPLLHNCDVEKLIDWTYEIIPVACREHFVYALKEGLVQKKKEARRVTWIATSLAAGVPVATAVSPVPYSDAPGIIAIQTGLVVKILNIYNIPVSTGAITGTMASLGVSQAGKMAAGALLKLIPVAGQVIGAAVNASVAGAFTYAIGETLLALCEKQAKQLLAGEPVLIDMEKILGSAAFLDQVVALFKKKKDTILDEVKEDKQDE